jgi:magnesium transporter
MPPGSLIHIGDKKIDRVKITVTDYDSKTVNHTELEKVEQAFPFRDSPTVTWLDITGLHSIEILKKISTHYQIHPLVMEDVLNTQHRPKFENFDHYAFITMKMLYLATDDTELIIEQVSMVLGNNFVITFQEREGDVFEPVRERIRNENSRLRKNGSDYLLYALMDIIVDNYFLIIEHLGNKVEALEDRVIDNPDRQVVEQIQRTKRELIHIRRSVWPFRDAISSLTREDSVLISDFVGPYLRDLHDHTIQVIDSVETIREMVNATLDIYLSNMSNKMNEVMKVLTIIATIFIPLTFLAGIYGMNFEFMPELQWRWSYPFFWIVISLLFLVMLFFFRKKKWL